MTENTRKIICTAVLMFCSCALMAQKEKQPPEEVLNDNIAVDESTLPEPLDEDKKAEIDSMVSEARAARKTPVKTDTLKIIKVFGSAALRNQASATWVPLTAASKISNGDEIRTMARSFVEIYSAGGFKMRLGQNALLGVDSCTPSAGVFRVVRGRTEVWTSGDTLGTLSLRTSSSKAEIYESIASVDVRSDGTSRWDFYSGTSADIEDNAGKIITLKPGQRVYVDMEKGLGELSQVPDRAVIPVEPEYNPQAAPVDAPQKPIIADKLAPVQPAPAVSPAKQSAPAQNADQSVSESTVSVKTIVAPLKRVSARRAVKKKN